MANGTEVESESYHIVRQLNAFGQAIGPAIQLTVFSQNGQTSNIWGMATDTPLIDGARYVKIGGSNQGASLYDTFVPCFTEGTLIVTDRGEVPVDALRPGDRVVTRDSGFQEVRWAGSCSVDAVRLAKDPSLRPILVQAGALGEGIPSRDTYFSPNHKVLLNQPEVSLHFGDNEVFAAAKDLTQRPGFTRAKLSSVTYVHLMFDRHEALISNGMWTESFLPGKVAMRGLGRAQRGEIHALFPELLQDTSQGAFAPARRVAKPVEISAAG